MWYWLFKYIFMGPLLSLLGRPKVEGLEHVPQSGPVILASNHLAVADSFYLPLVVSRRITFLAKAEYFTGTGLKGWFTRWFYTVAGQVPIDRTDADSAQSALTTAERILGEGKLLGMYPEGTRSPDGRLFKGKTGLARVALTSGVPVIPVAMIGTDATFISSWRIAATVCGPWAVRWACKRSAVAVSACSQETSCPSTRGISKRPCAPSVSCSAVPFTHRRP